MDLINYLNHHFYPKHTLLSHAGITEAELIDLQEKQLMPACSYRLDLKYSCDSFFGEHTKQQVIDYYSKGYASWLGMLSSIDEPAKVYEIFAQRYQQTIKQLNLTGHRVQDPKLNENLDCHIKSEWGYFLDGTYGLCTQSGLPEDIAAKEIAITEIKEIIISEKLNEDELIRLERAVNLLDTSSSSFAPHERLDSSRHRLVDEVRRQYKLSHPL